MYCAAEEEFARKTGKDIDLSDAVPFGLGEEDRDAVDPCTRAWLELLRCKKVGFKITAQGTETIKGQKFDSLEGRIDGVCSVSSLYCKRLARNEIKERVMKDVALTAPPQRSEDTATNTEIDKGPSRPCPKTLVDAAKRKSKIRSYAKFAARIGISKDTLYTITKETRWVSDATYDLVAEVCNCKPEDLHPRDLPRPERRRG